MRFAVVAFVILSCCSAYAEDDTWTVNVPEPKAPEEPEVALPSGSVLKWCEENGKKVRYSQTPVPGYRLCGQISSEKLCDPSGKRFISAGNSAAPSGAYRDCSIGERIIVMRHDPLPEIDPPSDKTPEPMSDIEKHDAHKQLDQVKQGQEGDMARELESLTNALKSLNGLNGKNPMGGGN